MPPPLILHCHMPKTAGSALNRQVLLPRFERSRAMLAYGVGFERRRQFPVGEVTPPPGLAMIAGHVPVGYADGLGRPVLHISILRDPVERMFSFLNFVAVAERHGLRKRFDVDMQHVAKTAPERFVLMMLDDRMVGLRQTNVMTRLASGMARLSKNRPEKGHLAKAITHINAGAYEVGVQEKFDRFTARLNDRLDAENAGVPETAGDVIQTDKAEKRLARVITMEDASTATIDAVRAANDLDQRLYEFVHARC